MSLLAARCKAIRWVLASNPEKSEAEILSKLVAYTSDQVSTKIHLNLCPVYLYSRGFAGTLIPLILPKSVTLHTVLCKLFCF